MGIVSQVDIYRDAWGWLEHNIRALLAIVSQHVGNETLALVLISIMIIPLTVAFVWLQYTLLPSFVRWWYEESITQKALNWWSKHALNFLGFKRSTAVIAVICGSVFFVLVRVAAAFPMHFVYTAPTLVGTFVLIAIVGFFVSGNVPKDDKARQRYFKRFQSPSVTGAGLAVASVVADFAIGLATIAVERLLQLISAM